MKELSKKEVNAILASCMARIVKDAYKACREEAKSSMLCKDFYPQDLDSDLVRLSSMLLDISDKMYDISKRGQPKESPLETFLREGRTGL